MTDTRKTDTRILVKKDGNIAWMLFNRPEVLNAMLIETWQLMDDLLAEIAKDKAIRCLILAGEGRAFLAGADIADLKRHNEMITKGELTGAELRDMVHVAQSCSRRIQLMNIPVISAVHGYAVGAGCEVAICADLVVADETAKFGFPEVTVGACITNAGTFLLPRKVGVSRAKLLAFTGEFIDAKEAHRIGLVDEIAPQGQVRAVAERLARRIASRAPIVVQLHKRMIDKALDGSFEAALAMETESVVASMLTEDNLEGTKAFFEKREPVFKGR
ncbi:MAG: enoyl-CoA hydratase/isomerase family protein [Alphaproteobacteria bacterium]